jgi:hypothetical protein
VRLSEGGQKYVRAQYEILRGEVTRWFQSEHRKLQETAQNIGAFGFKAANANVRLVELGVEQSRRLAAGLAEIYIKAYESEGHQLDAREIDEIMRSISDSVGQDPQVLSDARNLLLAAMHEAKISKVKEVSTVESGSSMPDFSFVKDEDIRKIVTRDYAELHWLDPGMATKSVLVLAGGILESLLLDALVTAGKWRQEEAFQKRLNDMIHPAEGCGIIREGRVSNVLRSYRNLIHPAREIREGLTFTREDAKLARAAVDVTIRDVSAWHGARKSKP